LPKKWLKFVFCHKLQGGNYTQCFNRKKKFTDVHIFERAKGFLKFPCVGKKLLVSLEDIGSQEEKTRSSDSHVPQQKSSFMTFARNRLLCVFKASFMKNGLGFQDTRALNIPTGLRACARAYKKRECCLCSTPHMISKLRESIRDLLCWYYQLYPTVIET
jgi:hypothetical protein